MDKLPAFSDSHVGQMSKFCSTDPFATFHLYPDAPNQYAGLEDLPLLPFTSEPLAAEHFYANSYGFLFQPACSRYEYAWSPAFIRKRNERERQRVKCVNEGYAKLRHHLPAEYSEKRLSKVETLLAAIRCFYLRFCPHFCDTCETIKNLKEALDTTDIPVLARRERDGYYYRGTVIKGIEGEKRMFLVQFTEPFAAGEEGTAKVQRTSSNDILEYVPRMKHAILPGDKVLAPWEPEQKRYGPGTVLQGMETRDPLREKEDEEIIVSFWNGKKTKVPFGVAMWISPLQWERVIEMIHLPYTSRKQSEGQFNRTNCICSHPVLPSTYTCTLGDFQRLQCPHYPFVCPYFACFHHTCSLLGRTQYVSCCRPKYSGCWCQPALLAELPYGDVKGELLALEGPPKAGPATGSSSSFSKSPSDKETSITKTMMVDHAVNTDYSLFNQPKLQKAERPDWKYWKRSHLSSPYKS